MTTHRVCPILVSLALLGFALGCAGKPSCEELRREHLLSDLHFLGDLLRQRAVAAGDDPAKQSQLRDSQLRLAEVEFAALLLGLDPDRHAETNARLERIIHAIQEGHFPKS